MNFFGEKRIEVLGYLT